MLGLFLRRRTKRVLDFFGQVLAKTKINPNFFTILALFLALIAAYFLSQKNYLWGLIFVIITSVWDALDGSLARSLNKVTNFGNYLDAMIDRIVEAIFYVGLALGGFPIESIMVVSGSIIQSYAKARLALVVPITNDEWPPIGDRVDRLIFISCILLIKLILPSDRLTSLLLYVLAAIILIGIIQRMIYAWEIIKKR